ncbi:hypothetical protein BH11PSE6_BH11PSE6_27050 [soil metagenome]
MAKAPPAAKPAKPAKPPKPATGGDAISVRMYRGLLGDCFLLTHEYRGETFRALIDCGVLQCIGASKPATKSGVGHIEAVVANLKKDTGGVLDLVIGTHEHYDHLSGFILHFDVWKTFTIRAVWVAWTENDDDDLAVAIREKRSRGLEALAALVAPDAPGAPNPFALDRTDPATQDRIASITDMLQFYGEIEPWKPAAQGMGAAATPVVPRPPKVPPRSCADVFSWLKGKAEQQNVSYLEPGQQVSFGVDNRLKAHVLGPPRTRNRLKQLDPKEGAEREVYLTNADDIAALNTTLRFNAVAGAAADGTPRTADFPFAARFRRWEDGSSGDPLASLYYAADGASRRIDGEWLGSAETLALKIDGDVNNTSLALAIEAPDRRVLLFPADAQVGNWLSWHDQRYPAKPATPDAPTESAQDILSRVVFYKVGHHGSHNATAREMGLEMMTSPDLVAMIPVVEEVAGEQVTKSNPSGWAMPYGDLYARLKTKTHDRIIRGDGKRADEEAAFAPGSGPFSLRYADKSGDPLWVELRLEI